MADASAQRIPPPSHTLLQHILYDRVLLAAFAVCVLLFGYQLSVILLQPPWIKPATDWLRTALAWPQLLVVTWVAVCAVRIRGHDAVAWCCLALGMLSYAVARTTWTLADVLIYPHGVPFPSLPDLFFILQYPFFIAGMLLIPAEGHWLPRVRTLLDAVLWMSAVTALSWYFVLLPIARETGASALSKYISMYYQVGDLVLFYGLVMALARPRRTTLGLVVISLISLAAATLFVADTWAAVLLLHPPHTYRTGSWPDLFWFSCYLLFPLAAVVRLRLTPAELPAQPMTRPEPLRWRDLLGGMAFVAPSLAVVGASMLIIVHATLTAQRKGDLMLPEVVSIALLLLAALRPGVMFLEEKQLRRERDVARLQEGALRLANARMETFLSVIAHELKTPLTTLIGNVHLMARRLDVLLQPETTREDSTRAATALRTLVGYCEQ
ncbi:MAG TPA: histidine kinase dimerization/phospho-acceptor domain-containing protein, partial [Ktedonobacterales bacterium]|nr:histidine kinase dimerization/phospho-acceptor domain-containing protein [Ktedonobacterales bacterium]